MKICNLISLGVTALTISALASCSLEPYTITAEEEYTRNFIKEFGLIDPTQDWNLAQSGKVTVNVGEGAQSVKVYSKINNKYYLVADLKNVKGSLTIPIDIPEYSNDIKVKVDGKSYQTTNGGSVDATGLSRGISTGSTKLEGSSNETKYQPGNFSLSVNDDGYVIYNAQQVAPIVSTGIWKDYYTLNTAAGTTHWRRNSKNQKGLLPEINNDRDSDKPYGNQKNTDVYHDNAPINMDFTITPTNGQFTIQPVYWQTSGYHVLGVYPIDENGYPISKSTNKPIVIPEKVVDALKSIDPTFTPTNDKANDVKWSDFTKIPLNQLVGAGKPISETEFASLKTYISNIKNDMVLLPFYADKGESDIQKGTPAANAGNSSLESVATTTQTMPESLQSKWKDSEYSNSPLKFFDKVNGDYTYDLVNFSEEKFSDFKTDLINYYNDGGTFTLKNADTNFAWQDVVTPDKTDYELTASNIEYTGTNPWEFKLKLTFTLKGGTSSADEEEIPAALVSDDATWTNIGTSSPTFSMTDLDNPLLARSKSYTVTLKENNLLSTKRYGMYIDYPKDNVIMFSESYLNIGNGPCPGASASFAASYKHPMSDRVYFSFEDWTGGDGDTDLNDLIFLLTNVDKVEGTNTLIINDTEEKDEETLSWLIASEDLGATDDFDFNDVIFSLQSITTNTKSTHTETEYTDDEETGSTSTETTTIHKEVIVQALAAGGTLPVWLHYNDGTTDYILGPDGIVETASITNPDAYEWHMWFNNESSRKMINTGAGPTVSTPSKIVLKEEDGTSRDIKEDLSNAILNKDFSIATYSITTKGSKNTINGFYITVNRYNGAETLADITKEDCRTIASPEKGAAPQMFLIPDIGPNEGEGWLWPRERKHIMDAYNMFQSWVKDAESGSLWYRDPTTSLVTRPATIKGTTSTSGN